MVNQLHDVKTYCVLSSFSFEGKYIEQNSIRSFFFFIFFMISALYYFHSSFNVTIQLPLIEYCLCLPFAQKIIFKDIWDTF